MTLRRNSKFEIKLKVHPSVLHLLALAQVARLARRTHYSLQVQLQVQGQKDQTPSLSLLFSAHALAHESPFASHTLKRGEARGGG